MGGTRLPTAQSTRPLLLLYLILEQGAPARAQPCDLGRILHGTKYRNSSLLFLYMSFIDYYRSFLCIKKLGILFVSVKYVFVSVKLVYVYVKLLKI
jgi:hypothetical protein